MQAVHEGIYKVLWVLAVQTLEVVTSLGNSAFLGNYKVLWLLAVQILEVVTTLGNSAFLGQQADTSLPTMTCVAFSQQGSSFMLRDALTLSVVQKMFFPKKCLSLAFVSIWPCQAEILQTHVEPLSLLQSVCLRAMTSISQSAQTFINKLKGFITICQLWCHCLLEQETLISLGSSIKMI